jgi:hypothetical protein
MVAAGFLRRVPEKPLCEMHTALRYNRVQFAHRQQRGVWSLSCLLCYPVQRPASQPANGCMNGGRRKEAVGALPRAELEKVLLK